MLKPPGTKHLKLKYDELLSSFAFKFNFRRYTLVELNQRRQDLLIELKSYEQNSRTVTALGDTEQTEMSGAIPRDTHVNSSLEMNPEIQSGELVLSTNNDTVIKVRRCRLSVSNPVLKAP
jgi:hypothetical protein